MLRDMVTVSHDRYGPQNFQYSEFQEAYVAAKNPSENTLAR